MSDRYRASGREAEFQPGSDGRVLRNRLGIAVPEEMDEVEMFLLEQLYEQVFGEAFPDRRLMVADLKDWHYRWLGNVYDWAGEERSVNLAKADLHFAAAAQVPRLLGEFQRDCLDRFTPSNSLSESEQAEAIAITHVELILIHPFREGNGRLARMLADVMAVQAGNGLLDYVEWDRQKGRYFAAIQQGFSGDYGPMKRLVTAALGR
jgi:cell filamentation protein